MPENPLGLSPEMKNAGRGREEESSRPRGGEEATRGDISDHEV